MNKIFLLISLTLGGIVKILGYVIKLVYVPYERLMLKEIVSDIMKDELLRNDHDNAEFNITRDNKSKNNIKNLFYSNTQQ